MQYFKMDATAAMTTFNPITEFMQTPEGVRFLVEFLSEAAAVALNDEKKAALQTIIEGLSEDATLATLINQIQIYEIEQLGIKPSHYAALAPLFEAFAHENQK